jgi:hypothetical protein
VKQLTYDQVAARKEKAVRFVRNVLDDPNRAAEIDDEAVEDYADRRRIQIRENPTAQQKERSSMTKQQLENRVRELEEENETLQEQLDQIADIAAPLDEDEDDDAEEDLDELDIEDDDPEDDAE